MISSSQPGAPDFFCSDCSRAAGEQVFGTAPMADLWLALEYRGAWTRKAVTDNGLPDAVRAFLNTGPQGVNMRPLLIRQPGRSEDGLACFVAVVNDHAPRLYRFTLDTDEDLLALDLPALARGDASMAGNLSTEPLILVCTNGKRDRACSREGMPVYQTLAGLAADHVWQSTHLGGHRFAATVLVLPAGLAYGHLTPQDGEALLAQTRRGQIDLAHLRGRTCYPKPVQAAAYYLRQATGVIGVGAFRFIQIAAEGETRWRVRFAAVADGRVHDVRLAASHTIAVYLTSTDTDRTEQPQYTLLEHVTLPSQ